MKKDLNQAILSNFDSLYEALFLLESIIKLTHGACLDKEIYSVYYNLTDSEQTSLSEERNHYINMLSLALDKVSNIKEINLVIEEKLAKLK